ncbi:MAG: acetyl-CoA decarbonylase/synthase complex subunit gamma [Candidatus Lokiarchaeota archaeon]|nr:acetyl-CoA decarbonylase/synthase complex subunit gamma [Candidatus Lokiarchaeota archaeon]
MVKRPSPLEIYKLLPKKADWGSIGLRTGMEFATSLLERQVKLDDLPGKISPKKKQKIIDLIIPPQLPVEFGVGDKMCTIGGEEAFRRHDLTFFNPTALLIEVGDTDPDLMQKVKYMTDFSIERIGEKLTLQGIVLRCVSDDPNKYVETVKKVADTTDLPLMLCSWNTDALVEAANSIKDKKPMLYAATKKNWKELGKCAVQNNLPVVCYSTDMDEIVSITKTLESMGVKEMVLDFGTALGPGDIRETLNRMQKIRYSSIRDGSDLTKWPVLGVPAAIWALQKPEDDDEKFEIQYREALGAIMQMSYDASALIVHTGAIEEEIWFLLALMTFRQNIFVDPRIYPTVDPGLFKIGDPGPKAPIFMTSNYRMTKIPVEQDLKDAHLDCWLLVVDSDGLGIEAGVAGGQLNSDKVQEAVKEYKAFDAVDHRILVIPGMAARLQGAIEDDADCYVAVGPMDSSGIQKWLEKGWKPDEFMKEYRDR